MIELVVGGVKDRRTHVYPFNNNQFMLILNRYDDGHDSVTRVAQCKTKIIDNPWHSKRNYYIKTIRIN